LLEWATGQGYILLSSDRNTLIEFYNERLRAGLHSEGVFILRQGVSFGEIIEELSIIAQASEASEWANQINFIPFRKPVVSIKIHFNRLCPCHLHPLARVKRLKLRLEFPSSLHGS
jgi:hypothetical protein